MTSIISNLGAGSRGLSIFLGSVAVLIAIASFFSDQSFYGVANWTLKMFGYSFLVIISALIILVCFSWIKMFEAKHQNIDRQIWVETGQHAANGVATLALTYTLLGISLGISTLSEHELNSGTIQALIGSLTQHFSLAFMTTVVGLPISGILRALIGITEMKLVSDNNQHYAIENK